MSEIKGVKELFHILEILGGDVQAVAQAVANQGALIIANDAKKRAPRRSGNLSRSIHVESGPRIAGGAIALVGTDLEYAAIHEFGGVIKPKNAKMLAIPLTKEAAAYRPRDFPMQLHIFETAKGNLVLMDDFGEMHYALKDSVTITAQPYLRPALDDQGNRQAVMDSFASALVPAIERAIRRAKK